MWRGWPPCGATPTLAAGRRCGRWRTRHFPPTQFQIDLFCRVNDRDGKFIKEFTITGQGASTFSEFKADTSLTARRAAQDAATKLMQALATDPALR